jgi:hypothetical protein
MPWAHKNLATAKSLLADLAQVRTHQVGILSLAKPTGAIERPSASVGTHSVLSARLVFRCPPLRGKSFKWSRPGHGGSI